MIHDRDPVPDSMIPVMPPPLHPDCTFELADVPPQTPVRIGHWTTPATITCSPTSRRLGTWLRFGAALGRDPVRVERARDFPIIRVTWTGGAIDYFLVRSPARRFSS